jgi:mannose-6-phosphate isomerase-like protein (cupin superfamily)
MYPLSLSSTYLRLRPDSSIEPIPVDGFWPRLMSGELGDFRNEYLVTSAQYETNWSGWEMHPHGEEIVCVLSGAARMLLETPDGTRSEVELSGAGSYVLIPRGTWHTAHIVAPVAMLFITAGEDTRHRPVVG